MNQRIILIEKDFPLTEVEVKRLQKKYPFITDNRIVEIHENMESEEVTGTVIDPKNRTLYPFCGNHEDFATMYRSRNIWNHAKWMISKEVFKHNNPKELLSERFSMLTEHEVDVLIYYLTGPSWAGAVVNTDPNVRDKKGEFIIFPYAYSVEEMMDLYPELELFELEKN